MGDPRTCRCVSRSLCGEPDPGSVGALAPVAPGHSSYWVQGQLSNRVSRAQLSGRAWWGLLCSCCARLLWSPQSWLCHLFLPRLFLSSSFYFSFQTWPLPNILSLLLCVLTRRPALLPVTCMAGRPGCAPVWATLGGSLPGWGWRLGHVDLLGL